MNRFTNLNNGVSLKTVNHADLGGSSPSLFSRLQSIGGSMNRGMIIGLFIMGMFALAVGIYLFYYLPSLKSKYQPNNENFSTGSLPAGEAELMLFYVDWCPHCKTAKPVWNEIKSQYENKTINGYTVIFTEINCTEESAEVEKMMNKYNIEGFPTIKLLKDGQVIEYDAKPTQETLQQFLTTVL